VDMRVKPEDKTIIIPFPADCREQSLPSRVVLPINSIAWHNCVTRRDRRSGKREQVNDSQARAEIFCGPFYGRAKSWCKTVQS